MSAIVSIPSIGAPGRRRAPRGAGQRASNRLSTARTPTCELCGRPGQVRVLEGYQQQQPVFHEYCLSCAESAPVAATPRNIDERAQFELSTTCIVAGVVLGTIAVAADSLGLQGHSGFGWVQRTGMVLGALIFGMAALLRVDLVAMLGLAGFSLSLIADVARIGESAGMGWKQQLLGLAAALLLTACLWLRSRRRVGNRVMGNGIVA